MLESSNMTQVFYCCVLKVSCMLYHCALQHHLIFKEWMVRLFVFANLQWCHSRWASIILSVGWFPLGLGIYGYLCTRVGYIISGRLPGYPHHLGLRRNQRFLRQKQDGYKISWNSHTSESKMYQNHEFGNTKIQFFWHLFIIVCINHNLMWKSRKSTWNVSNLQHFSVYIGVRVTH